MFFQHPESFKNGIRILSLAFRNKDQEGGNKFFQRISYNASQFDEIKNSLIEMGQGEERSFRIYSTVEERCDVRARRIFKQAMVNSDFSDEPLEFYKHSRRNWTKALTHKTSAKDKLWLFDCDTYEETESIIQLLKEKEINDYYNYITMSGMHFITKPFNIGGKHEIAQKCLHRNALMLWYFTY